MAKLLFLPECLWKGHSGVNLPSAQKAGACSKVSCSFELNGRHAFELFFVFIILGATINRAFADCVPEETDQPLVAAWKYPLRALAGRIPFRLVALRRESIRPRVLGSTNARGAVLWAGRRFGVVLVGSWKYGEHRLQSPGMRPDESQLPALNAIRVHSTAGFHGGGRLSDIDEQTIPDSSVPGTLVAYWPSYVRAPRYRR